MTGRLPARSIGRALRASHERLVSDALAPGDPHYPWPEEDFLEFALVRMESSWERERERDTWTVPDDNDDVTVGCTRCGDEVLVDELGEHWDRGYTSAAQSQQSSLGAWSA